MGLRVIQQIKVSIDTKVMTIIIIRMKHFFRAQFPEKGGSKRFTNYKHTHIHMHSHPTPTN